MMEEIKIIFDDDNLFDYVYPDGTLRDSYKGWKDFFNDKEVKDEIKKISDSLSELSDVLPDISIIFKAFELTSYDNVKVVIGGQDPYPDKGSAMGLCFSIFRGRKINASMQRIQTVLIDSGFKVDKKIGDLTKWAEQGVFLPNSAFTVGENKPESHIDIWRWFFILLIKFIKRKDIVWLLFGMKAHAFSNHITSNYQIKTTHPVASVKSKDPTVKTFNESKCFKRCNELLLKLGKDLINFDLIN